MIKHLDWDSAHFGFRIGKVEGGVPEVSAEYQCLYFLAPGGDRAAQRQALDCGFINRGERVILSCSDWVRTQPPPVRKAVRGDLDALAAIEFPDSRFSQDPRFPRERVRTMYLAWIDRLLDSTYVVAAGNSVAAYVSCAEENAQARICLFAVAEPFRGCGFGRQLVDLTKWWAAERDFRQLTVVTQGSNEAALRLYQRNGFYIVRRDVWFHWWRS